MCICMYIYISLLTPSNTQKMPKRVQIDHEVLEFP